MEDFFEENNQEVQLAAVKKDSRTEDEGHLTVDVFQTEDEIVVQSTIAGVDPDKDVDISVTNDMVTIKGRRNPEQKIKPSDYYWQELYWGSFSRSIILPVDVDADSAKASYKNGVLTIKLPKLVKLRSKQLKVS